MRRAKTLIRTDLSLRWVHMPFCWFCHEAAEALFHNAQCFATDERFVAFALCNLPLVPQTEILEQPHDKTNKMTCAPSELSESLLSA